MKYRTTFQLGALALLLGSALYIADEHREQRQASRVSVNRVFDITTEPISAFGVDRDGLRLECVRREGKWFLRAPIRARANARVIEQIVAALESLKWQDYITREQRESRDLTFSDYGLAPPVMSIWVVAGGRREALLLGAPVPFEGGVYGLVNRTDTVFVLPEKILGLFPSEVTPLRERSLLYGDPARADRLDIYRRDIGFLQLVRQQKRWMLKQPFEARADSAAVERLLDAVFGVQVARFHWDAEIDDQADGEEAPQRRDMAFRAQVEAGGLAPDAARVKLGVWTEGDPLGQELFLGRETGTDANEIFVRRGGVEAVYTVPTSMLELCAIDVDALRDRTVFQAEAGHIRSIKLKQGENRIELERMQDGRWQMQVPVQTAADRERVDALVTRLLNLRVQDYLPSSELTHAPALGLEPPALEIEADLRDESARPLKLALGNMDADGSRRYARIARREELFTLAAGGTDDLGRLEVSPLVFRHRTVLAVQTGKVFRLHVSTPAGEARMERNVDAAHDGWHCMDNTGTRVDQEAVHAILTSVEALTASRFVAFQPRDLSPFGLETPSAVITLGLRGADGIRNALLLGDPCDGFVHAMVQGHDFVFLIPADLAARFTVPLCVPVSPEPEPEAMVPPPPESPATDPRDAPEPTIPVELEP